MQYRRSTLLLTASLTLSAVASAQAHDRTPAASVPIATLQAAGAALEQTLLVDEPRPGEIWVRGSGYKAAFTGDDATFYPFFGPDTPRHFPVRFGAPEVRLGGEQLAAIAAAPRRDGDGVRYDRGTVVERYLLSHAGIEQRYVFDALSRRDGLTLRIPVTTELSAAVDGDGLRFAGAFGAVTYSQAVAVDGAGAALPLATRWVNGAVEITVPRSFVATARLPLVVDPLITTQSATLTGPAGIGNSDLSFDNQTQTYLLVYEQPYTNLDHDVYGLRLSSDLTILGTPLTIDYTTDSWTLPRVANHKVARQFLTVAEVHDASSTEVFVAGRQVDVPSLNVSPQFDIASSNVPGSGSGDKFRPDVGGAAAGATVPADNYLVVWEREYLPTDADVHARLVTSSATLVGTGAILLANLGAYDARPTISKSNVHTNRWQVCYQRQQFGSTSDWDILGARVRWDGVVLGSDEVIAGNVQFQGNCAVSSATVGSGFPTIVAYENRTSIAGQPDIGLVVVDHDGNASLPYQLTALEAIAVGSTAFLPFEQVRPSVATDGARVVVSYRERNTATMQYDTFVTLLGLDAGSGNLSIQEPRVPVTSSPLGAWIEDSPASITSRWDSAHLRLRYDVTADFHDTLSNTFGVGVWAYLGHTSGGGVNTRNTGCGNLAMTASGWPAYGGRITFQVTNATGLPGFLFGTPASYTLTICPSCTIGVMGTALFGSATLNIDIPPSQAFLGQTYAVQGLELAPTGGVCLGQFKASNTIDFTIE